MEDQAEGLRELMRKRNVSTESVIKPKEPKRTRIITVTSGKGGVGKTNISINMAIAYARMGKKVVVMDADLGLANVNVMLNIVPKWNLYHVMRKQKTMKEILLETKYGISLVAGVTGISQIANLSDDERQNFIVELDSLTNADIIIIDTSAGVSNNVLDFIAAADDAIIITTPEPTSITDAYSMAKIIASQFEDLNIGLKLVVNQVKSATEARQVAERMTHIVGQFLNIEMEYLGFIYNDMRVAQAVLDQKPFIITDHHGKASICIQHLVDRMEKTELRQKNGFGALFKRLFSRKL
ncbi:MAG: MinD/ParA family protein [Treponema sp.]|jgi:flagellar biosynthesis protein FlhG|nr:MinD/ParA family protein [Treponema sp.]